MASTTNVLRYLNVFGPLTLSILLIFFAALDIVNDIGQVDSLRHVVFDMLVFFSGAVLNLYFVHRSINSLNLLIEANQQIHSQLQVSFEENQYLKEEQLKFRQGLNQAIEEQLKKWQLTPSEVEISFLLLKGLSNKEIAEVRQTSESTVRLQCSSIYKKSNLNSRTELAAFFIEDML